MDQSSPSELQFEYVDVSPDAGPVGARCSACEQPLAEYYDINGHVVCADCAQAIAAAAESPVGLRPLLKAALWGFVAAVAGAIVYFTVLAVAGVEIGLIAILCGYMVGWAVRRAAGGRGGRRFQLLAIGLTYLSVSLAYAPLVITGVAEARNRQQTARTPEASYYAPGVTPAVPPQALEQREPRGPGSPVLAIVFLLLFLFTLPALTVISSLPSGLIAGAIISFGMHQAWRMTGAPDLMMLGPYRVTVSSEQPSA